MAPKMKKIALQFWNKDLQEEYENDSHHPLVRSFGYNFLSLELEGFGDMVKLLEHQGWIFFSSSKFFDDTLGTDPESVRLFYINLRQSQNVIKTIVHNHEISFTFEDIQKFIASLCPWKNIGENIDGICLGHTKEKSVIENIDIPSLLDPSFHNVSKPTTSHLTRDNRLLAHIIFHAILPHEGSMTSLNPLTLSILHCLNKKILVNLPHLIVSHMFHSRSVAKYHYPYANFITLFLHKKFKIPISQKRDFIFQLYDKKNLINIFTKDETTKSWIFSPKSNSNKRPRTDILRTPSTSSVQPMQSLNPSSSQPESDPSMDTSQNSFQSVFLENLSKLVMNKVDERMDKLEKLIKDQHEQLHERISMCELRMKNHVGLTNARMDKAYEMFEGFGQVLKYTKDSVEKIASIPPTQYF